MEHSGPIMVEKFKFYPTRVYNGRENFRLKEVFTTHTCALSCTMSADLRRGIAYFGPREKVYKSCGASEVPGLPKDWRRILAQSYPCPILGPFGQVYQDMEHALVAFRYLYASSCPHYAEFFRMENDYFAGSKACRRYGSSNGLSLLQSNPDDRVWFIVRDRCMFDIVYQRICRDALYRHVLTTLMNHRYLPVYHVRTADSSTYWGATMNRDLMRFTNRTSVSSPTEAFPAEQCQRSQSPTGTQVPVVPPNTPSHLPDQLAHLSVTYNLDANPAQLLVGQNRLGSIMVQAYRIFYEVHHVGVVLRNVTNMGEPMRMPTLPPAPLHPGVVQDHAARSSILASSTVTAPPASLSGIMPPSTETPSRTTSEDDVLTAEEWVDRVLGTGDMTLTEEDFLTEDEDEDLVSSLFPSKPPVLSRAVGGPSIS